METHIELPLQADLPRLDYEAPAVADYGNAAELTQALSE
jgi:hypothetical protein